MNSKKTPRPEDPGNAERVAANILESIAAPLAIGAHEFIITSSIGISCYPEDGDDADVLLKIADTAMYRAKDLSLNSGVRPPT